MQDDLEEVTVHQYDLIARQPSRKVLTRGASQCPHRRCHWRSFKSESTTTSFGPDLYTYRTNIHPAASEPGVIRLGPRLVDQCHGQGVLHGQDECGAGTARGAIESTHGAYQREGMAGVHRRQQGHQDHEGAGFSPAERIPAVHTDFVVFASEDVGKVKTYVRVLEILGGWLPVIALLVAAAGVYVAFNRRHALIGAALAVFVAMLVLGIGLTVARDVYLDRLPPGTSQAAAGTVYDALVRFLRAGLRAVAAVALFTAAGAFLAGPARIAALTRTGCRRSIGALRDVATSAGLRLGPVGRFVHRFKRWIGVAILVVAAVVLFTWSYPTTAVVVWTAVIILAGFAIREFLDDDSAPPAASRAGSATH
ncbi:hypothetical protein [Streptomyces sp. ADI98-10]|uniref:hypothetical protein n=1 Tax=Streptomyces sp. ADI98-10 TaxID=1522763 RepID=UPI001F14D00B|nr:hypothetical protein [Streptomyces sp. ADI98-10]